MLSNRNAVSAEGHQKFRCMKCKKDLGVMNDALLHLKEKHPENYKKFMSMIATKAEKKLLS